MVFDDEDEVDIEMVTLAPQEATPEPVQEPQAPDYHREVTIPPATQAVPKDEVEEAVDEVVNVTGASREAARSVVRDVSARVGMARFWTMFWTQVGIAKGSIDLRTLASKMRDGVLLPPPADEPAPTKDRAQRQATVARRFGDIIKATLAGDLAPEKRQEAIQEACQDLGIRRRA